jgi:pyruvate formate lyase activating enzyme
VGDAPLHSALLIPGSKTPTGGYVHAVEAFCSAGGPGLRHVLVTAGCRMHCLYCHAPDSWTMQDRQWTDTETVLGDIAPYAALYRRSGGLTVSGGEPLMQADFVGEVFRQVKQRYGLHTALDTNGNLASSLPDAWFDPVDLILLDIKHMDPEKHYTLTGHHVRPVLDFAKRLYRMGKPVWIRYVLVPGYTDDLLDVEALADFVAPLRNVERVEIIPFHKFGEARWKELGRKYLLADTPVPSPALIDRVRQQFECRSIPVAP